MEFLIVLPVSLVALAAYATSLARRNHPSASGAIMRGCLVGLAAPALMLLLAIRMMYAAAELKNGVGMGALIFLPVIFGLEIAIGLAGAAGAKFGLALATGLSPVEPIRRPSAAPEEPLEGAALLETLVRPTSPTPVQYAPQPTAGFGLADRDRNVFTALVTMLLADAFLGAVAIGVVLEYRGAGSGLQIAAFCIVAYAVSFWAGSAVLCLARDPENRVNDARVLRRWAVFRYVAWANLAGWLAMWIWLYVDA